MSSLFFIGFLFILEFEGNPTKESDVDLFEKWFLLLCSLSETRIDNGEKLNLTAASSHKRFHKSVPSLIDIVPTIEQRLLQPSHSIFSNLFDQHANLWFLFDASGKNCMKQIILGSNFVFIFDFF